MEYENNLKVTYTNEEYQALIKFLLSQTNNAHNSGFNFFPAGPVKTYTLVNSNKETISWITHSDLTRCGDECFIYSFGAINHPKEDDIIGDMIHDFVHQVMSIDPLINITLIITDVSDVLNERFEQMRFIPSMCTDGILYQRPASPTLQLEMLFKEEEKLYNTWIKRQTEYQEAVATHQDRISAMRKELFTLAGDYVVPEEPSFDKEYNPGLHSLYLRQRDAYQRWFNHYQLCYRICIFQKNKLQKEMF